MLSITNIILRRYWIEGFWCLFEFIKLAFSLHLYQLNVSYCFYWFSSSKREWKGPLNSNPTFVLTGRRKNILMFDFILVGKRLAQRIQYEAISMSHVMMKLHTHSHMARLMAYWNRHIRIYVLIPPMIQREEQTEE